MGTDIGTVCFCLGENEIWVTGTGLGSGPEQSPIEKEDSFSVSSSEGVAMCVKWVILCATDSDGEVDSAVEHWTWFMRPSSVE